MNLISISIVAGSIFLISASSCNRNAAKDKKAADSTNAVTLSGTPSDVTNQPPGPTTDTSSEAEQKDKEQQTGSEGQENSGNKGEVYGLVVSFYSPGNGINRKAKTDYDAFLEGFKGKVEVEQVRWGREGEIDYCLKLSNLSAAEKKDFIVRSKQLLEKADRVNITENTGCVHKK